MSPKSKIHFEISERKILLRVFDVVSVLVTLQILGILLDFSYFKITQYNFYWTVILSFYILFFGTIFEMYNLQVSSNQLQITRSIILSSSLTVLFYLLTPIVTPTLPDNRSQIILFYFAIFFSLLIWRFIYLKFFASTRFFKKVIIICDKEELKELVEGLQNIDPNYKIVGFISSDSNAMNNFDTNDIEQIDLNTIENFITRNTVSEAVIASRKFNGISPDLYNELLKLLEKGFLIREYTQVYENLTQRIPVQYIARDFYKYFPFSRNNQNKLYIIFVRFQEITISFLGLLCGLIIFPFIFIGNLIANRGPVFYTQDRVGKNGSIFKIYKLRTMIVNAETNGAVFSTHNDCRITRFGKFLRKSRIDEIPQFINILRGDMGIIGPRPERPVFVKEIAQFMPFYETRHIVKPGLTGWAQVNYSYGETLHDSIIKLQYDLYYIKHRGIFLDFNIILKTISTVLFYRGQ
jgi:exopolysaccharide biosynthesis polyprenyl glycosylphosphotransferase